MTEKSLSIKNLLSVDQLNLEDVSIILNRAKQFSLMDPLDLYKEPTLKGEIIANLFFENSTRTQVSFEIAAKRLSAEVVGLDIRSSSISKGETLLDTIKNLEAFGCRIIVLRHSQAGILHELAEQTSVLLVNAGDGQNEHPTQALLDAYTLYEHFNCSSPNFLKGLKITIIGDIKHSRVAKSNMKLLPKLGASVTVFGPLRFLPEHLNEYQVRLAKSMEEAIADADAVMMLRIQKERIVASEEFPNLSTYYSQFGLTAFRLKQMKDDAVVMHPGPMNRGIEIDSEVADHQRSLILRQAKNGVFVRMAVFYELCLDKKSKVINVQFQN